MEKYYYGVARARTLEARLLTPAQVARMAAASDFQAAFAVLSETIYADHLAKLKAAFDLEELCELELSALKKLMDQLAPGNEVLAALFRKYDYFNLKILLRGSLAGAGDLAYYSLAGTLPFEKLKLCVYEGIKEIEDQEIFQALDEARVRYEPSKDPQMLDITLDRHYYRGLKRVADSTPSRLIRDLVKHLLDLANLRTLLRCQELKRDKKFLEAALLEPGLIDKDVLLDLREKSLPDIVSRLNYTPYFPALAGGFEGHPLEKLMDDFILDQFRKAKYLVSGIEPLVGFTLAKESEIKTVRFVLICKKNYVEAERIKERLRASYA
jgi:V/A-type H+-transporting ATPase subunit C